MSHVLKGGRFFENFPKRRSLIEGSGSPSVGVSTSLDSGKGNSFFGKKTSETKMDQDEEGLVDCSRELIQILKEFRSFEEQSRKKRRDSIVEDPYHWRGLDSKSFLESARRILKLRFGKLLSNSAKNLEAVESLIEVIRSVSSLLRIDKHKIMGLIELAELVCFPLDDFVFRSIHLKNEVNRVFGHLIADRLESSELELNWRDLSDFTISIVPILGGTTEALELKTVTEKQLDIIISHNKKVRVQVPVIINRGNLGSSHYLSLLIVKQKVGVTYRDALHHVLSFYRRRFSRQEVRGLTNFARSVASSSPSKTYSQEEKIESMLKEFYALPRESSFSSSSSSSLHYTPRIKFPLRMSSVTDHDDPLQLAFSPPAEKDFYDMELDLSGSEDSQDPGPTSRSIVLDTDNDFREWRKEVQDKFERRRQKNQPAKLSLKIPLSAPSSPKHGFLSARASRICDKLKKGKLPRMHFVEGCCIRGIGKNSFDESFRIVLDYSPEIASIIQNFRTTGQVDPDIYRLLSQGGNRFSRLGSRSLPQKS